MNPEQNLGRYRLIRLIGQGSFSKVYLGEHLYLKSEAAIKVLSTKLSGTDVTSFINEAQTIASLVHPHIIRIFDFDVETGTPFLVMDFASKGTLRQRHPKGKAVPLDIVVNYTKQIADALQYAHDRKLIHCDVKPENMLIGRSNEILLSDFGIVQVAQTTQVGGTNDIAGTIPYMAPEQFQGKARFSSDQYALGVVVYEWLCGERPFQGSFFEVASQHISTLPQPLIEKNPTVPPAVNEVVMTALAKDPKQRFASVTSFARALEQASLLNTSFSSSSNYAPLSSLLFTSTSAATNQSPQEQQLSLAGPISSMDSEPKKLLFTDPPTQSQSKLTVGAQSDSAKYNPIGSSAERQSKKKTWLPLLLLALVVLLIMSSLTAYFVFLKKQPSSRTTSVVNGIGISMAPNGEYIGISSGGFAFDTNRPDGALKSQAAEKFKAGKTSEAETLWQASVKQETNDAEALIYLEDQRVLASKHPYITFVIGTILNGGLVSVGRDNLQGAYVAQKEYNDALKLPGKYQIRLLIANSGSEASYASHVAQQIVQAAQVDKTIVGVVGWPYNGSTIDALEILDKAHIPLISPTASGDSLTDISPYFFRVVPSDRHQVLASVQYAEQKMHAKKVALFVDPNEAYSKTMASDFQQQFADAGNSIVDTENYTVGHPQTLVKQLQNALSANPDLIYFSGYANDVVTLLANLPDSGPFAGLQVLGGDALSGSGSYPRSASNGFNRLHFSESYAFNEWVSSGLEAKSPIFFTEYIQTFDPNRRHTGDPHGFSRADNITVLSYDSLVAFLSGSSMVLSGSNNQLSPGELQQGLTKITGSKAIQGVSGQISLGPNGNPFNKAVVIMRLDVQGDFTVEAVYGNLLNAA